MDSKIGERLVSIKNPRSSADDWTNWQWQQRNAVRSVAQLQEAFPDVSNAVVQAVTKNSESRKLQLTPYYLSLIHRDPLTRAPRSGDPLWQQAVPEWSEAEQGLAYDGHTENWELPHEMVTPIAQHKYPNRVIIRLSNACFSYCQFCYEALRTLEKKSSKSVFQSEHWEATVAYVRATPDVEEVILSGGEPLLLKTETLERVLADLRSIDRPVAIRIHTRALTFNPFRITEGLLAALGRHRVEAVGLHVTHPNELTPEFEKAARRLSSVCPILFANMPLLGGVNDDVELMHELCMKLYRFGVVPHYLYHFMPHSPGLSRFRTSVQAGVDIIRALKRRITNLAVPEFVLPHHTGKHSLPLLAANEPRPSRERDPIGGSFVVYQNWRGDTVRYPDTVADHGQS